MSRTLLTGNGAAAWAARLADVDYIPAFPITPQTEIIETLGQWIANEDFNGRMTTLESEHSMITAAASAATSGVRVFTATSSQGLLYGMEMLYTVAGWRAPFVLANVSRGLASPITLEPDHNDIFAARDCGFIQLHSATCQDVLDNILLAYKLAEHPEIRLPAIVNLDGFYLSFTRESVELPKPSVVQAFLGEFDPMDLGFKASSPLSQAVAVLGGTPYSYFRYESHLAIERVIELFDSVSESFARHFNRRPHMVETYRNEDADICFIMMGSFSTKAKAAVDQLRDQGIKIGLVQPRLFRPFPKQSIAEQLINKKAVTVIDQNISMGSGGVIFSEVSSALYQYSASTLSKPPIVNSVVGGLGGRDISSSEFAELAKELQRSAETQIPCKDKLLFTQNELDEVHQLQTIANAERHEIQESINRTAEGEQP